MERKNIVVFCGSKEGYHELYRETAYSLGQFLARKGARIICGGSRLGLMGAVSDGALDAGGEVIGVIPGFLQTKEITHEGLTQLIRVKTMHERKMKMFELGDSVITLPGGWGTMEEMFEMITWAQLGLHQKPIGVLNLEGYYDSLKALSNLMVQEGFLQECHRKLVLFRPGMEELWEAMESYSAPDIPQWMDAQST